MRHENWLPLQIDQGLQAAALTSPDINQVDRVKKCQKKFWNQKLKSPDFHCDNSIISLTPYRHCHGLHWISLAGFSVFRLIRFLSFFCFSGDVISRSRLLPFCYHNIQYHYAISYNKIQFGASHHADNIEQTTRTNNNVKHGKIHCNRLKIPVSAVRFCPSAP